MSDRSKAESVGLETRASVLLSHTHECIDAFGDAEECAARGWCLCVCGATLAEGEDWAYPPLASMVATVPSKQGL